MFLLIMNYHKYALLTWRNIAVILHQELANVSYKTKNKRDFFCFSNWVFIIVIKELKCLLGIKNSKETKLSEGCEEKLSSRRELWNMAQISDSLSGVNDLARLINESEHRSYLFFILFSIFAIIFALGCLCRPAVFKARRDKRK